MAMEVRNLSRYADLGLLWCVLRVWLRCLDGASIYWFDWMNEISLSEILIEWYYLTETCTPPHCPFRWWEFSWPGWRGAGPYIQCGWRLYLWCQLHPLCHWKGVVDVVVCCWSVQQASTRNTALGLVLYYSPVSGTLSCWNSIKSRNELPPPSYIWRTHF